LKRSSGNCYLCGTKTSKTAMLRHLASCLARESRQGSEEVIQLRIDCEGLPEFWLDVEVKPDALLTTLDSFLRRTWLECCGHLSAFTIGQLRYVVERDDWEVNPSERAMKVRAGKAIGPRVERFTYEYDYGSTTRLRLQVTSRGTRRASREPVTLLARNDEPVWRCSTCDAPAVSICPTCVWSRQWLACAQHELPHGDCDDDVWSPVVNSPRMGVCGFPG
jgi:hypothetical protein